MNYISTSQIRVFLSSTFADMQSERNALVKLFRTLTNEGRKRGIDIKLIDLRWGITDDQKRNGRVISTCFQEIDNTRPFFIGIVGDRYGWVPSHEEIAANKDLCDRFPIVNNYSKEGLSITEMEMRYSLQSNNTRDDSLFLIKSNSKTENIRHQHLKEFLTNPLISHASYSTIEELTNIVERKMHDLIEKASPDLSNMTELERFEFERDKRIIENSAGFIEVGDTISKMDEWLSHDDQYLVVSGDAGSGKSSLISYWLKTRNINGRKLIAYFVDDKDGLDSVSEIQRYILTRFEKEYDLPPNPKEKSGLLGYESYKYEIEKVLKFARERGDQWLIVIDGLNQLENKTTVKYLSWLPCFPKTVKVLLSTTQDDFTYQILCSTKEYRNLKITLPDAYVCAEIIRNNLAYVGKALDKKIISDIANAPLFHNPRLLRLLMEELVTYGIHEEIPNHIARYVSSSTKKEFYGHILRHAEEYYGFNRIKEIASLLSITQDGLTEDAIIEILNIEPIDWSMVYCGLQRLLSCINGKYHFVDIEMLEVVNEHYFENNNPTFSQIQENALRIISYLEKENNDNDLMELAFQYACCGKWEKVYRLLIDPIVSLRFIINKENIFVAYWVEIIRNTFHSPDEYLKIEFHDHDGWDAETQIAFLARLMEIHFSKMDFSIDLLEKANDILIKKMNQPGADKKYLANILAKNFSHIASNYTTLSEFDKTREYLEKAEKICLSVGEVVDSTIYMAKGILCMTIGNFRGALDNLKLAYEIEVAENKNFDNIVINYKYPNHLGLAYSYLGNFKMALKYLEEALDILRLKHNIISIDAAAVLNNLGLVYQRLNQYSKAMYHFSMAKKGYEQDGATCSREMAILLSNIGVTQQYLNNIDNAIEALTEAYEIHKVSDPESMDHALCAINLGHVFTLKRQYADAIPYLKEGVLIFWSNVDLSNSYLGMGAICLIEAYTFNLQYADAEALINSLGQRAFEELGKINWVIAHCHYRRAILYKTAGITNSFIIEEYNNARDIFYQLNESGMVEEIDRQIQAL